MSPEEVLEALSSGPEGLSEEEARKRLDEFGPNRLPEPRKQNVLLRFFKHFHDVLIYVLIISAIATALLGHWIDTWIILAVVILNSFVGFVQEGRAEKAIEAVRRMLSVSSSVSRDGKKRQIPAEELVPGDIVLLSSGDKIPADLRLIRIHELQVNEASLTGESDTVSKTTEIVKAEAALGDRTCMAYSGTIVVSGTARAIVISTGENTEIGKINRMLAEVEPLATPLLRKVNSFGIKLSIFILAMAGAVFLYGSLVMGMPFNEIFLFVVAIAVAAIPEGLPAVISIILAIGVRRMAGRNAIIRRLPGVETLGSVTVICTDKTGTLTKSEMTVSKVVIGNGLIEIDGAGYEPEGKIRRAGEEMDGGRDTALSRLVLAASLCNGSRILKKDGSWVSEGNPTEGSLLTLALKAGLDPEEASRQWQRLDTIPFESEHKFMATLNHSGEEKRIFLKGAPESVIARCSAEMDQEGKTRELDAERWASVQEDLAGEGFRLLAIADKDAPDDLGDDLDMDDVKEDFTLLGVAAIMDPPRPEAIDAVEECRRAGIRVKMITGDHLLTATVIAKQMGIGNSDRVMTGPEIEDASDEELGNLLQDTDIFARVSPEHKLRIVSSLQERGHITAMTGDGVNDAPALKKADIGIAMGIKGTEAAKEASEMVLTDDNFASIVHAVEEGRTVYDNLKKTLIFMLPTNGGEALLVTLAIALGVTIPITPAQVLWVNMVTAVTLALSLAFEPMESNVMERPPRSPKEPLVDRLMLVRISFVSFLLMASSLGLFSSYISAGASTELSRTIAVNTLIIGEVFYLFNSRTNGRALSVKGLMATPKVWTAAVAVILLQIPFTYLPSMQGLFGTEAISLGDWLLIFSLGLAVFLLVEAEKALFRTSPPPH